MGVWRSKRVQGFRVSSCVFVRNDRILEGCTYSWKSCGDKWVANRSCTMWSLGIAVLVHCGWEEFNQNESVFISAEPYKLPACCYQPTVDSLSISPAHQKAYAVRQIWLCILAGTVCIHHCVYGCMCMRASHCVPAGGENRLTEHLTEDIYVFPEWKETKGDSKWYTAPLWGPREYSAPLAVPLLQVNPAVNPWALLDQFLSFLWFF